LGHGTYRDKCLGVKIPPTNLRDYHLKQAKGFAEQLPPIRSPPRARRRRHHERHAVRRRHRGLLDPGPGQNDFDGLVKLVADKQLEVEGIALVTVDATARSRSMKPAITSDAKA
jgi:hypothetical protein